MSSPSPVCSSCLSWRRTIWSMHSPFSSLLPLARCSPLPSCSSCQRFAIHTYIPVPQKHTNSSLTFLCYAGKTFWHLWPSSPSCLVSSPSCLCFAARVFSGSNQGCGRLWGFALTASLIIWEGYICVHCMLVCLSAPSLHWHLSQQGFSQRSRVNTLFYPRSLFSGETRLITVLSVSVRHENCSAGPFKRPLEWDVTPC